MEKKAFLFDIYKGTTHDGPGMRITIFFKGCPLSCKWCHNPEGISTGRSLWWEEHSCIGCLTCEKTCTKGAILPGPEGIHIDRLRCDVCLDCVNACPAKALTAIGEYWDMEKLLKQARKYSAYYNQTGGGVTVSGGEAMMQAEFIAEFFRRLRDEGIHTALDTSGLASWDAFQKVLPHTDIVLYDLKLADPSAHEKFCGVSNEKILDNAIRIADGIRQGDFPCDMWVRTPLIPDATATAENIRNIGAFIRDQMHPVVSRWELCAFNNSCINKYKRLNQLWEYEHTPLLGRDFADSLLWEAKQYYPQTYLTGIIHEEEKQTEETL